MRPRAKYSEVDPKWSVIMEQKRRIRSLELRLARLERYAPSPRRIWSIEKRLDFANRWCRREYMRLAARRRPERIVVLARENARKSKVLRLLLSPGTRGLLSLHRILRRAKKGQRLVYLDNQQHCALRTALARIRSFDSHYKRRGIVRSDSNLLVKASALPENAVGGNGGAGEGA